MLSEASGFEKGMKNSIVKREVKRPEKTIFEKKDEKFRANQKVAKTWENHVIFREPFW